MQAHLLASMHHAIIQLCGNTANCGFLLAFLRKSVLCVEPKNMTAITNEMDTTYDSFLSQILANFGDSTIEDVYTEVLLTFTHHQRFRDEAHSETNQLISHLQKVFLLDEDKHSKLLAAAESRKISQLILNLEIVEAKGLKGKDVNGLSDPACTIFISPKCKESTSIKFETLNPVWQEYFSLPVKNASEDILQIELRDYDGDETVAKKIKRIGKVKSSRGLKIYVRDLAKASSSVGKPKHDFLGCLKLPLTNIPVEGVDSWYTLERKRESSLKKRGEIHLRMGLGVAKEKKTIIQQYHQILHMLLAYELVYEQNVEPYKWDGEFKNNMSKVILQALEVQGGLTKKDVDVARLLVYTNVHCEQHAINPKVFLPLLQTIFEHMESQLFEDKDELSKVWLSIEKLTGNFTNFFQYSHKHQQYFSSKSEEKSCAQYALRTLEVVKCFLTKNPILSKDSKLSADSIVDRTKASVSICANEFFFDSNASLFLNMEGSQIEHMIRVGQSLIADLKNSLDVYQPDFKKLLGVSYFDIAYLVYDKEYGEMVKTVVAKMCAITKPRNLITEDDYDCCQEDELSKGTSLFKLYLVLKQLADLSSNLDSTTNQLCIHGHFHNWFHNGIIVQWLDIARFKAMNAIKAAVEQDVLQSLDEFTNITSSAVDTAGILQRIEIWNQLSWPEVEGASTFIAKILDDIGGCAISYADLMWEKIKEIETAEEEQYQISEELCYAINNIERVSEEMHMISEKVGVNHIIENLAIQSRSSVSDQLKLTLMTVTENNSHNIDNKVIGILEEIGLNVRPIIEKLIMEAANKDCEDCIEKLETYLGNNLYKLNKKLSKDAFEKVFSSIWESSMLALKSIVNINIEKRKQPEFFQGTQKIFNILINFFYPEAMLKLDSVSNSDMVKNIKKLIDIHGSSTPELLAKYCKERQKMQLKITSKTAKGLGYLTVRMHYCKDTQKLRVQLLNARNLKPRKSNGFRDPYVKIIIVADELPQSTSTFKSRASRKTLFPLFDETFFVPLTMNPNEHPIPGMIMFTLKDFGYLGTSEYIGDCFALLNSVKFTTSDTEFDELPQEMLPLSLPSTEELNSLVFKALENRQWDKNAVEFVKRERIKSTLLLSPDEKQKDIFVPE